MKLFIEGEIFSLPSFWPGVMCERISRVVTKLNAQVDAQVESLMFLCACGGETFYGSERRFNRWT